MSDESNRRAWQLIANYANDQLPDEGVGELESLLLGDAELLRDFVLYMEMHGRVVWSRRALRDAVDCQSSADDLLPTTCAQLAEKVPASSISFRLVQAIRRPTPLSWTVAAIVMAILVTTMAVITPPVYRAMTGRERAAHDPAPVIVAQLTGLHEAVWTKESSAPQEGAWLQGGQRLELTSGMAEVMYLSGAKVLIEGPAQFHLLGSNAGHLAQGRVTAKVPEPAHGFTVDTPVARIIDLGTEFGVQVAPGQSGVQVFEGKVEVAPKSTSTGATTKGRVLVAGEGIVIDNSGIVVLGAQPDAQVFRRQLPDAAEFIEITPEFAAVQNYGRLHFAGVGRAGQDAKLNSYDAASGGAAGNQFVWFDMSSSLSQLPAEGVEKVVFRWEGVILPSVAHRTNAATVQTDLGLFAVPDDERGVPSVFVRGDGKDNVNFYAAHAGEISAMVTVPAVKQKSRFLASWDITKLVQHWLDNPEAPRRGQFIIVNAQHPVWVQWEGKMPRVYAQVKSKDLPSRGTHFDSPAATSTEQEKQGEN